MRHTSRIDGFAMMEVLLAGLILSAGILMLVNSSHRGLTAVVTHGKQAQLALLANDLLSEIQTRRWDEQPESANGPIALAQASSIGRDAGEPPNDKTRFDDIDDFDGWVETGVPQHSQGQPMQRYTGFTRRVAVRYVDLPDAGGAMTIAGDGVGSVKEPYKSVAVTVEWHGEGATKAFTAQTVLANVYR